MGHYRQERERHQSDPAPLVPFADQLAQENYDCQPGRKSGAGGADGARPAFRMFQNMPPDCQSHNSDGHEDAYTIEWDSNRCLTAHQEHDQDGDPESNGYRTCEGTAWIAIHDSLGDLADGNIPPFSCLCV